MVHFLLISRCEDTSFGEIVFDHCASVDDKSLQSVRKALACYAAAVLQRPVAGVERWP